MKADTLRKAIVTGLGTGYLRPAPGSWGSLAVCVIFLALVWASIGVVAVNVAMALLAVSATVGCVALGGFAQEAFGRKDPGQCTLDEWAGQAVSLLALPLGSGWGYRLVAVGMAFFFFRLFDSIKPSPLRRLEKLDAGMGIVADDLAAGVYTIIVVQVLLRAWPGLEQIAEWLGAS